jgi:hypothetical protein
LISWALALLNGYVNDLSRQKDEYHPAGEWRFRKPQQ